MVTRKLPVGPDDPTRVYAVGDVHGHADKLSAMHEAIRRDLARIPTPRPLLIHLGDYIDRGPNSAGCLSLLASTPPLRGLPTVNLMGNHERMMLDALEAPSRETARLWLDNGGDKALESWGILPETARDRWAERIPAPQLGLLHGLALYHRVGTYLFVHAGVRPGIPLADQRPHDLVWIRRGFLEWEGEMLPETAGTVVVHGHTPAIAPVIRPNRIGVDTNAGGGGPVTCVVLEDEMHRFIAV